jgi:hypothetical protein
MQLFVVPSQTRRYTQLDVLPRGAYVTAIIEWTLEVNTVPEYSVLLAKVCYSTS